MYQPKNHMKLMTKTQIALVLILNRSNKQIIFLKILKILLLIRNNLNSKKKIKKKIKKKQNNKFNKINNSSKLIIQVG